MEETVKKAIHKVAEIYVVYMCVIFVAVFHNNYIDIMQAKRYYFLLGTGIACLMAGFMLLYMASHSMCTLKDTCSFKNVIVYLMMAGWLISMLGAPDRMEAVIGNGGKCTGLFVYLLGGFAILLLGNYLKWSNLASWAFVIGSLWVCGLQSLNRFGVDPLHMYSNIHPDYITKFISTIGQINYNASLNCIIMSVLMAWFLICNQRLSKVIYGITIVIAFAGSICCNSDSVYLGIAVIFYVLVIYTLVHPDKWKSLVGLLILMDLSAYGIWYIRGFCYTQLEDTSLLLMNFNLRGYFTGMILAFLVICILIAIIRGKSPRIGNALWVVVNLLILVVSPLLVKQRLHFKINPNYFLIQQQWSNARTHTWQICIELFQKSNLWHKLFGYGFNNVYAGLETIGQNIQGSEAIVDAHNVVLNSLITSGLIGTILWAVLLMALFVQAIRGTKKQPENLLVVTGLIAYMAQGMVNGPQILTTPVFLTAVGVYWATVDKEKHIDG